MSKNVMCDDFAYSDLECIIICDASIQQNSAGIGWVIIDYNSNITLAEGRAMNNKNISTVDAELLAVITALKEVQKMNYSNVLIKIDYDGFIKHLNKNNNIEITSYHKLNKSLSEFNMWGFEKVNREQTVRAHNLASSIDLNINYCPIVTSN